MILERPWDPTGRRAFSGEVLDELMSIFVTLSEHEAGIIKLRFGLVDGEPRTLNEIGQVYGVTHERIRQIEAKVMSKLRHPARSVRLRDFSVEDAAQIPERVRARILGRQVEFRPSGFCDRHGWFDSSPHPTSHTCEHCPCVIEEYCTGRPRRYCSDACRQAAYRRRKRIGERRPPDSFQRENNENAGQPPSPEPALRGRD